MEWHGQFYRGAQRRSLTHTSSNVPQWTACNPSTSKHTRGNRKQSSAKNNQNICRAATPRYQAHPHSAKQMVRLRHHSHTHILLRNTLTHSHPHIRASSGRVMLQIQPTGQQDEGVSKKNQDEIRTSVVGLNLNVST